MTDEEMHKLLTDSLDRVISDTRNPRTTPPKLEWRWQGELVGVTLSDDHDEASRLFEPRVLVDREKTYHTMVRLYGDLLQVRCHRLFEESMSKVTKLTYTVNPSLLVACKALLEWSDNPRALQEEPERLVSLIAGIRKVVEQVEE